MIRIDKSDLILELDERIYRPSFVAKFYTVDKNLSHTRREAPDKEEEDEDGKSCSFIYLYSKICGVLEGFF